MLDNQSRNRTTISDIIYFYQQQIERFKKIGIGNYTEFNTLVTNQLIDVTIRRLHELQTRRDKLIYNIRSQNGTK